MAGYALERGALKQLHKFGCNHNLDMENFVRVANRMALSGDRSVLVEE